CVLLVTERDHAQPALLHAAREVGDRDSGQSEDGVDAVQFERIDNELEAVRFGIRGRIGGAGRRLSWVNGYVVHVKSPVRQRREVFARTAAVRLRSQGEGVPAGNLGGRPFAPPKGFALLVGFRYSA